MNEVHIHTETEMPKKVIRYKCSVFVKYCLPPCQHSAAIGCTAIRRTVYTRIALRALKVTDSDVRRGRGCSEKTHFFSEHPVHNNSCVRRSSTVIARDHSYMFSLK